MTEPVDAIMVALAIFYAARLDDDERVARAALQGEWHFDLGLYEVEAVLSGDARDVCYVYGRNSDYDVGGGEANGNHIVRHDPARVLRGVEAKRAFLEIYTKAVAKYERYEAEAKADAFSVHPTTLVRTGSVAGALGGILMELAAVYADHPDYEEGWKP